MPLRANAHAGTPRRQARPVIVLLYVSTRVLVVPGLGNRAGFVGRRTIKAELVLIFLHAEVHCARL